MEERAALTTGLEFLGKLFALADNSGTYRRAAYAPLFQTDGLYDPSLERVPEAFAALEQGNPDVARAVLTKVAGLEAKERAMSNFAPGFQAHHGVSMGGLAMLTPDYTMEKSFKVRDLINSAGIYTGTNRNKLISGSSRFFHPAAHTNPETQTTGAYKAGQKVLSQFRQDDPIQRVKAALPSLQWENNTSKAAFNLQGEQALREGIAKLIGIPIEDMMSTERDDTRRKNSEQTKASSNTERLRGKAPLIKGMENEIIRTFSNELYIPVMYKNEYKNRPGTFSDWKMAVDAQEKDYMNEYLRTERPGTAEAIDQIMSDYSRRSGNISFLLSGPALRRR